MRKGEATKKAGREVMKIMSLKNTKDRSIIQNMLRFLVAPIVKRPFSKCLSTNSTSQSGHKL